MSDLARRLAGLPSLTGSPPSFEPGSAPPDPGALFDRWFAEAVQAGVAEPHAMTLATVGADGVPDARVLILKDFDPSGRWAFSTGSRSAKALQLARHPVAALSFAWHPLVRSVRIRGAVAEGGAEESRADFLARSLEARAVAASGDQSGPLPEPAALDAEVAATRRRLEDEPDFGADGWRKYWLAADTVEFWQGDRSRQHLRLQYRRRTDGWTLRQLRP